MKAMVLTECRPIAEGPLHLREIPAPEPGPDEIRIQVRACGICHTDLHTVEGEIPLPKRPVIPGHQVVGMVDRVGRTVTRFKEGDRVGMAWLYSACGQCKFCTGGKENLCERTRFTGYHADGGYAQYATIPAAFAYPLPGRFSDLEAAPLLCAGIIGYRALRLSEVERGQRIGLYGFGASAHIAIQIARSWGCEVYVFTRSPEHQRLARTLGASWTGEAAEEPPGKIQSAIIFAPAGPLVLDALRVLEKGGTVALAGIYMTPIPEMDYFTHLYNERTLRSVTASTRRDGEELLQIAAEIPIKTTTKVFPLEEANQALQLLKGGAINGAGVLTIPAV